MLSFFEKNKKIVYLSLLIYWALLLFFTSLPGKKVPQVGLSDKTEHFLAFAGLAFLLASALPLQNKYPLLKRFYLISALLITSFYGCLDELHQLYIPDRSCDILDWTADSIGGIIGILSFLLLRFIDSIITNPGRADAN